MDWKAAAAPVVFATLLIAWHQRPESAAPADPVTGLVRGRVFLRLW